MFDGSGFDLALRVLREGLLLSLLVSAPVMLAMLLTGALTGILQSITQVHDHAVGFVPRFLVMLLALALLGPFLGAQVVRFAQIVFSSLEGVR